MSLHFCWATADHLLILALWVCDYNPIISFNNIYRKSDNIMDCWPNTPCAHRELRIHYFFFLSSTLCTSSTWNALFLHFAEGAPGGPSLINIYRKSDNIVVQVPPAHRELRIHYFFIFSKFSVCTGYLECIISLLFLSCLCAQGTWSALFLHFF